MVQTNERYSMIYHTVDQAYIDVYYTSIYGSEHFEIEDSQLKEYFGWTYLKFTHTKLRDTRDSMKVMPWCREQFGDEFGYMDRVFYFKESKYATMFVLRWLK